MNNSFILITKTSKDYELIDSGEGEKLERFGQYLLARPDPQALWQKNLPTNEWKKANGYFIRSEKQGDWSLKKEVSEKWSIDFSGLKLWIKPTAFKHVGLFPEQSVNWDWMKELIVKEKGIGNKENSNGNSNVSESDTHSEIEILNLFAYTGGATLACAQAGAKVVHVDGSKTALSWARENAELSGLKDKPIRWILDDAREFVKKEIKRGRKYHGIIMDPPAFGHGPDNELWKIEDDLILLIEDCMKILVDKPLFFLINGYAAGYSAIAYKNNLLPLVTKFGGDIEVGELVLQESKKENSRLLPCGIFARWFKD